MDKVRQQRIAWALAATNPVNEDARSAESEAFSALHRFATACNVEPRDAAEWIIEAFQAEARFISMNEKARPNA